MKICVQNLYKSFQSDANKIQVIQDLSFCVQEGEFTAILGQSGCGKSTLLRIIGGFDPADSGTVWADGQKIDRPSKDIMMIFQNDQQLFPWKTVKENILYALKKTSEKYCEQNAVLNIRHCLEDTGLAGFENSYPLQLSGGMKQRAALARALALQSKVMLMDEPFSSLDYFNRRNAQELLLKLWNKNKITVLFVTHDIDEALLLAQKIAVFDKRTHRFETILNNDGNQQNKAILEKLLL